MAFFRRPIVGYVILVVGILLAVYLYTNAVNDNLRDGLSSSCERVNILRAQSNLSDSVSWIILSSSAQRERALSTKSLEASNTHKKSADILSYQAATLTVTGITNCKEAIERPRTYNIPKAVSIGNARTLEMSPEAQKILEDSKRMLARSG